MKSNVIPESWLKCMSKEDRAAIGQMTAEEALEKFVARNERQLQSQIVNLLRLKGIEVCWHRTDKKSAATIGWPDITFAATTSIKMEYPCTIDTACAWEIKFGDGDLSAEQKKMAVRLQSPPNCWNYKVIRSVQEALKELREMGVE